MKNINFDNIMRSIEEKRSKSGEKIQSILSEHGYKVTVDEAIKLWEMYSNLYSANFLTIESLSDEVIFNQLNEVAVFGGNYKETGIISIDRDGIVNKETDSQYYHDLVELNSYDVNRITGILVNLDYNVNECESALIWEAVSQSRAANWLILPEGDDTIFSMINDVCLFIDENTSKDSIITLL